MKKFSLALTLLFALISMPFLSGASPDSALSAGTPSEYTITGKGKDATTAGNNARVAALRAAMKPLVSSNFIRANSEAIRQKIILQFSQFTGEATVEETVQKGTITELRATVHVDMPKLAEALKGIGSETAPDVQPEPEQKNVAELSATPTPVQEQASPAPSTAPASAQQAASAPESTAQATPQQTPETKEPAPDSGAQTEKTRTVAGILAAVGAQAGSVSHDPDAKTLTLTDFLLTRQETNAADKDSYELRARKIVWNGFSPDALQNETVRIEQASLTGVELRQTSASNEMALNIASVDVENWKLNLPASGADASAWKNITAEADASDSRRACFTAREGSFNTKDKLNVTLKGSFSELLAATSATSQDGKLTGLCFTDGNSTSFQTKAITWNSLQLPPLGVLASGLDNDRQLTAQAMEAINHGGTISIQDSELRFSTNGKDAVQHLLRLAELTCALSSPENDASQQYTFSMKGLEVPPSLLDPTLLGCPPNTLKAFLPDGEMLDFSTTGKIAPAKPDGKNSQLGLRLSAKHLGDLELSCGFLLDVAALSEFTAQPNQELASTETGFLVLQKTLLRNAEITFIDRGALAFALSLASEMSGAKASAMLPQAQALLHSQVVETPTNGLQKITSAFAKAALSMLEKPGKLTGSVGFSTPLPLAGLAEIPADVSVNAEVIPGEKPILGMVPAELR